MGTSSPSSMNSNCDIALENNYPLVGYPTIMVNDVDGGYYLSGIKPDYDAFYSTTPEASPAGIYSFDGSTLNLNTKTKFWSEESGEYYVTAFVVEDKVEATQNGKSGTVEHHYLLRGTMSPDLNPFGLLLHNGSIPANTEYSQNFSITIPSLWKQENISVILAVYKKEGIKYAFVNAAKATMGTTSIDHINKNIANTKLYPNPTTNAGANLEFHLNKSSELTINVYDVLGKVVYTSNVQKFESGQNTVYIPTHNISAGFYNVSIIGLDTKHNETLIVK